MINGTICGIVPTERINSYLHLKDFSFYVNKQEYFPDKLILSQKHSVLKINHTLTDTWLIINLRKVCINIYLR